MILAPIPTVRQTLESLFQLVVANAPGSGTPTGQRQQIAAQAEDVFTRYVEGTVRAAVAAHVAAEAESFDARVEAVVKRRTDAVVQMLKDAQALASTPQGIRGSTL